MPFTVEYILVACCPLLTILEIVFVLCRPCRGAGRGWGQQAIHQAEWGAVWRTHRLPLAHIGFPRPNHSPVEHQGSTLDTWLNLCLGPFWLIHMRLGLRGWGRARCAPMPCQTGRQYLACELLTWADRGSCWSLLGHRLSSGKKKNNAFLPHELTSTPFLRDFLLRCDVEWLSFEPRETTNWAGI